MQKLWRYFLRMRSSLNDNEGESSGPEMLAFAGENLSTFVDTFPSSGVSSMQVLIDCAT